MPLTDIRPTTLRFLVALALRSQGTTSRMTRRKLATSQGRAVGGWFSLVLKCNAVFERWYMLLYFISECCLFDMWGVCLFIGLLSISAIKVTLLLSVFEIRNCSINFAMNSYLLQQLQLCWRTFPELAHFSRTGTLFPNR